MLGINLFEETPGIKPVNFPYEIRSIEYIEHEKGLFIAGGDKSGKLKVFIHHGAQTETVIDRDFKYKISSLDFIVYGKNSQNLGIIVALEVEGHTNLYFNPNILPKGEHTDDNETWLKIEHPYGSPRLVLQPYVTTDLDKIVFSFKDGFFVIANLKKKSGDESYYLEPKWRCQFHSRIVDGCVEFPKYLKSTRKLSGDEENRIYLASKAGFIMLLKINRDWHFKSMEDDEILIQLRVIPNSIRQITPLSRIPGTSNKMRGILGITATDFFCLYKKSNIPLTESSYHILTERYPNSLHTLAVGNYEKPREETGIANIIFVGDSQKAIHARQFSRPLTPDNIAEVLFEKRLMFREKMEDRIFRIIPVSKKISSQSTGNDAPLLQLAFGLGNHKIVFKNLVNKVQITSKIKNRIIHNLGLSHQSTIKTILESFITKAREGETDTQVKYELMTAVFDHKNKLNNQSLALSCLTATEERKQREEKLDLLIQLIHWLLSSGDKYIYLHLYRKICELIQDFDKCSTEQHEEKWLYEKLDQVLFDIDKFWIGGESYSLKKGDLFKLIQFNNDNLKPLDKLIYQACINDRKFTIENTKKIAKQKIRAIARFEDTLFVSDKAGRLYLLDCEFAPVCAPFDINDFADKFYGTNTPTSALQRKNFIRQIICIPDRGVGIFLLQNGGLWIFPMDKFSSLIRRKPPELYSKLTSILFKHPNRRLIGREILVYRLKQHPVNGDIFFSDLGKRLYRLHFEMYGHKVQASLLTLMEPYIPHNYPSTFDFDFLSNERLVIGDNFGIIKVFDRKFKPSIEISVPSAPHINFCKQIDNETTIFGTRDGKIIAYDFSSFHPLCKWTYSLSGKICFIQKAGDKKMIIGGLCPEALVLDYSGKLINVVDFNVYARKKSKYLEPIQAVLPFEDEPVDYKGQLISIVAGDQKGNMKKIRFFHPKIFEEDIRQFFYSSNRDLKESDLLKVKLRTINIRENSLRRIYTDFESRDWSYDDIRRRIEQLSNSKSFQFHNGPLVHLIPKLIDNLTGTIQSKKSKEPFQQRYTEFHETVNDLVNGWNLKNDPNCQEILRLLGINLFHLLLTIKPGQDKTRTGPHPTDPNTQKFLELINHIHIHCTPFNLVLMYETIRQELVELSQKKSSDIDINMEGAVDFICQKLKGNKFDEYMADALPRKYVEVLVLMVEPLGYCPIKLTYKLFNANAGIAILNLLTNKMEDENVRKVFQTFYRFAEKLLQFESISDELTIINNFPDSFPENFKTETASDPFYTEFTYIFDCAKQILEFSDAMAIASSGEISGYTKKSLIYFDDLITSFNLIIEKLPSMKEIFQKCLEPSSSIPLPLKELLALRDDFEVLISGLADEMSMGELYSFLLNKIAKHLFDILSIFCEVTLPILCLENTATFLEDYLDGIRKKEQPLPALDNPDSLKTYNHFFRRMFNSLIVGMRPKKSLFCYPMIIDFNKTQRCDFMADIGEYLNEQDESDISPYIENPRMGSLQVKEIPLHLPDLTQEYGKYKFYFSESETVLSQFKERFYRFQGFVSVLNLYLMAFNNVTEAEMQSRFSHRLFAHQSKEPLIAIRNHLILLNNESFQDPDGLKTKEYIYRMLRGAEQLIKRSDYILEVRKLFRHAEPNITQFRLEPIASEVLHNMRKVMSGLSSYGEIILDFPDEIKDVIIFTDESKLRELLEQLIKNSIKYCEGKRNINVSFRMDKGNVHIKVRDNGVGIPNNELPYIFSPYFRGMYGELYNIDGDGLGLWVVKTYSDMLEGKIYVRSKTKKGDTGTAFTLIIPQKLSKKNKNKT